MSCATARVLQPVLDPEGTMLLSSSHQRPGNIGSPRTLPKGSGQPHPGSQHPIGARPPPVPVMAEDKAE